LINGLSLPLDVAFEKYSRGMKMKQSIAVALAHDPKLLILDEATSGLDPVARDAVVDMLLDFTREENHSILVSSHIVSDLEKLCDYIAFIHEGKLLLCEEKDVLLERYGVIHLSREQFQEILPEAVLGYRSSPYGVEAVVDRAQIPQGFEVSPVAMEDLFVFMIKGKGGRA
ncbi:MAG: ATP-binding cassette domain-containing protein, partial [Lachnospiraceae bacterium]|nr:ATP-binding cassette domain-containing protein [Lachnospiraceae bacterium]